MATVTRSGVCIHWSCCLLSSQPSVCVGNCRIGLNIPGLGTRAASRIQHLRVSYSIARGSTTYLRDIPCKRIGIKSVMMEDDSSDVPRKRQRKQRPCYSCEGEPKPSIGDSIRFKEVTSDTMCFRMSPAQDEMRSARYVCFFRASYCDCQHHTLSKLAVPCSNCIRRHRADLCNGTITSDAASR